MREIAKTLAEWSARGEPFGMATVVAVAGSHPRAPGACLLVSADGARFAGSVSSGCLENELIEAAPAVVSGDLVREFEFGPDGSPPWREGLTCGGTIRVRLERWWGCSENPVTREAGRLALAWLAADEGGVVLSRGGRHLALGGNGAFAGDAEAFSGDEKAAARALLSARAASRLAETPAGALFLRVVAPPRRLVVVGAVDIADHLVALAHRCGYRTVVIEPRRHYADGRRFSEAPGSLVQAWPAEPIASLGLGARDAAVVLTHDPKIDDVALQALLAGEVGYIGALGSVTSHVARLERLTAAGLSRVALERIEGPAGLRLGGADAASIALGIMAGIVRRREAAVGGDRAR